MPTKIQIQPGERAPIKLSVTERKLVLEDLPCLSDACEEIVRATPAGTPVMMTFDDLEELGGHVAAEANHCEDSKKQKKLDSVFDKIQSVMDKYTDEGSLETSTIKPTVKTIKPTVKKTSRRKAPSSIDVLYQFKVTLLNLDRPVWRRIQIQNCTLDKLHEHIQTVMGWTNSHLHVFYIKGQRYCNPSLLDDEFDEFECADSTVKMVSEVLPKTGKRFAFKYEYDFGDGWEHEILYEGNRPLENGKKYPLCLEGERACPPEDIGGAWGYSEYLRALSDPTHERHDEFMEWTGPFEPGDFDTKKATRAMQKGRC